MTIKTKMSQFQEKFEPQLKNFFERKISNVDTPEERRIWEKIKIYTLTGGKRIRPFFIWQMLEKTRTEIPGLPDILVAFELLHNSTLVEDDIIDRHSTRRNKPTLPKSLNGGNLNGEHISLIAAGLMRCASLNLILTANAPDEFKKECVNAYNKITLGVNEGQTLDLIWANKLNISEPGLLLKTEKVTARFIKYMFKLGAVNTKHKNSWAKIGLHFGVIFQLMDDLLDIDKNKYKGRTVGDDIRLGKATPLIIDAYNNLPAKDKKLFEKNFGDFNITAKELDWMINVCKTTGAIRHVRELIKERLEKIDAELSLIGVQPHHWAHELKKFSIERIN